MAADLGLHDCWFHGGRWPHYDLPVRRTGEITSRCRVVPSREIVRIIRGDSSAEPVLEGGLGGCG
jgi:hypothetical protein